MREHMVSSHPGDLGEVLTSFRRGILKPASSPLERQVREAVEISRASGSALLNKKEEYNRCLLPRMIMEGPKPIRAHEEEFRLAEKSLSQVEEEHALLNAKRVLKTKLNQYKGQKGQPVKKIKTATSALPGYQLPPTWDDPVITPRDRPSNKGDIRTYLRPLRRCPRPQAAATPEAATLHQVHHLQGQGAAGQKHEVQPAPVLHEVQPEAV